MLKVYSKAMAAYPHYMNLEIQHPYIHISNNTGHFPLWPAPYDQILLNHPDLILLVNTRSYLIVTYVLSPVTCWWGNSSPWWRSDVIRWCTTLIGCFDPQPWRLPAGRSAEPANLPLTLVSSTPQPDKMLSLVLQRSSTSIFLCQEAPSWCCIWPQQGTTKLATVCLCQSIT